MKPNCQTVARSSAQTPSINPQRMICIISDPHYKSPRSSHPATSALKLCIPSIIAPLCAFAAFIVALARTAEIPPACLLAMNGCSSSCAAVGRAS